MNTKPDIDPPPVIGRTLAETELLIKALSTAEIGQVFTYAQLNEICKDDVQIRNTILQTAKRSLMKAPYRMVFGTIMGVGIKRLSDEEIPDEGAQAVKRSRNIARKGVKKLACADIGKMTPETKIRHITTSTVLSLFQGAGSRKVHALAEQSARVSNGEMKIGDVSSLFAK
jgi:hypothetical protein